MSTNLKIVIAEPSAIVRYGLETMLKRLPGLRIQVSEIATIESLTGGPPDTPAGCPHHQPFHPGLLHYPSPEGDDRLPGYEMPGPALFRSRTCRYPVL